MRVLDVSDLNLVDKFYFSRSYTSYTSTKRSLEQEFDQLPQLPKLRKIIFRTTVLSLSALECALRRDLESSSVSDSESGSEK